MGEFVFGRFSRKGQQLQKILISFLGDEELLKLVFLTNDNPLGSNLPVGFDPYSLLKTRLYTQLYMPPTEEEVVNVCVFYKKARITNRNPNFKNTDFTVAIIMHRDLWDIKGGLRAYEIADRVDRILNKKYATGALSKDWFKDLNYVPVDNLYCAIELNYSNWD